MAGLRRTAAATVPTRHCWEATQAALKVVATPRIPIHTAAAMTSAPVAPNQSRAPTAAASLASSGTQALANARAAAAALRTSAAEAAKQSPTNIA